MNRLAEEAAYFGAVEDGARSRDDEIERLQKQIMILREALGQLSLYVAHNGDDWVKIQALATIPSKESEMTFKSTWRCFVATQHTTALPAASSSSGVERSVAFVLTV